MRIRKSLFVAATMRTSVLDRGSAAADAYTSRLLENAQQPVCASIGMSPISSETAYRPRLLKRSVTAVFAP